MGKQEHEALNGDGNRYTGINHILKSRFLQEMINKFSDGTFEDFVDDWKWIFSYSKKYKWIILLYTVSGVFSSTLGLASSVVSKYMIDIIVGKEISKLWILALIMIGSTVFSLVLSSVVSRISVKISIYVNNDIQADIFEKIMDADWKSLNQYTNGDLLNRFSNDVGTVSGNAVTWLPTVIIDIYSFVATFVVILHYDVTMAFIALVSAPFLLIASRYIMRKMREYRKQVLEMNSKLMTLESETFYNMDTIKSFGITGHYIDKLAYWQGRYKKYNLDYNMFSIKTSIFTSILGTAVSLLAFGYCLFRLWTNAITYGTMTLFLQQRSSLTSQFDSLVSIFPGMLNSAVSAHRIRELVELPREVHLEESRELDKYVQDGLTVQMRDVDFSYVEGERVLTESQFTAKPGEIVALIGASGEGKTTMIRLLLGLVAPENGQVVLRASDGTEVPMNADTRRMFSYVPQGNTILSGTVAENMRMVKENASDEEIIEALKIACAWDFVSKMPEGINSAIGERGKGVSEGQAQRIAIARAILRDSPVLLLDEATSALDTDTERNVLTNIIRRRPNKVCIVTTHRPSVLGMCQRIYRITDTRVTEVKHC